MNPKTADYPFASFSVNLDVLKAVTANMIAIPVEYGWGAKAYPIGVDSHSFRGKDEHGKIGAFVDCSGFTRYAGKKLGIDMPDGSVNQHDWAKEIGLKVCHPSDCSNKDGRLRMFFLPPHGKQAGHTGFILNDHILESHGHKGVDDQRLWSKTPWASSCEVFVIDPSSH